MYMFFSKHPIWEGNHPEIFQLVHPSFTSFPKPGCLEADECSPGLGPELRTDRGRVAW